MTEHEPLDPLPRELADLFESERARPNPPGAVYVRILERVSATIVPAVPGDGSGGGNDGGGPAGGAAAPAPGGATGAAGAVSGLGARAVGLMTAVFLAGAGAGASIHALTSSPTTPAPSAALSAAAVATPAPSPTASANAEDLVPRIAVADLPSAAVSAAAPRSSANASASATATRHDEAQTKDTGLAGERALLEEARMAMAQGRPPAAITALTRHETEFPRGRLAEEREAMLVQALARAGRKAEAESHARVFRERYGDSLLLPIVESALR